MKIKICFLCTLILSLVVSSRAVFVFERYEPSGLLVSRVIQTVPVELVGKSKKDVEVHFVEWVVERFTEDEIVLVNKD